MSKRQRFELWSTPLLLDQEYDQTLIGSDRILDPKKRVSKLTSLAFADGILGNYHNLLLSADGLYMFILFG